MKYTRLILITLSLSLMLLSCGAQTDGRSLKECGQAVISLMDEMIACESYSSFYTTAAEYSDTIAILRTGDYENAAQVYRISVSENDLLPIDTTGLSDSLSDYLNDAAALSLSTRINQQNGVEALSVSVMYAAQMTFVSDESDESTMYLYTFADGVPILICFLPGNDQTVRAVGYFILNDALKTSSADEIKASLAALGFHDIIVEKQ